MLHENAALIALLKTIDRKRDSWTSIADTVERVGSALAVFNHEIDPKNNKLFDEEDPDDLENSQPALFEETEEPNRQRVDDLNKALLSAEGEVMKWSDEGLDFISVLDERYPNRLRQVVDLPPFLFAKGALRQDDMGVSVVGSRKATPEAIAFAQETASMLVSKRLTVIAGLAAGIDAAAHRQTLAESGRTVAFIGTGIKHHYPTENRGLQEEISNGKSGGLVLSQFWPDQGPTRYTFPMRNASMSGYGIATVVVQANEHSGTRIQARQAQQHGRPVILRDAVVEDTQWARKLRNRPGVFVVSSVDDVSRAIDQILHLDTDLETAIDKLVATRTPIA
jgi:DNA processing protein